MSFHGELKFTTAGDFMRYGANGMPMVEKEVSTEETVVSTEETKEENVTNLNNDVEEGNVPTNNE